MNLFAASLAFAIAAAARIYIDTDSGYFADDGVALTIVHQADDTGAQSGTVVGLNRVRRDDGITPAFGQRLLLPCRPRRSPTRPWASSAFTRNTGGRKHEPQFHDHWNRAFRIRRSRQIQQDIHLHLGV